MSPSSLTIRRPTPWDEPTLLDEFLDSPLSALAAHFYQQILRLRGSPIRPPPSKPHIRVVCISDTHDEKVAHVPFGDVLIHAGDLTSTGTAADIQRQIDWLSSLPHPHKIVVCGNHDSWFDRNARHEVDVLGKRKVDLEHKDLTYLQHRSITLQFKEGRKLNIYGAPDVPACGGSDNAFQYPREEHPWENTIPMETDILVTHGPPKHHMDLELGCDGLLEEVWRVKPKLHVFGHVHCGRGLQPIFWDDCQLAYEAVMSRKKRGLIRDMIPHWGWVDMVKLFWFGLMSLLWQWLMLGNKAEGSLMINAGCQDGTKGRLNGKVPFIIDL